MRLRLVKISISYVACFVKSFFIPTSGENAENHIFLPEMAYQGNLFDFLSSKEILPLLHRFQRFDEHALFAEVPFVFGHDVGPRPFGMVQVTGTEGHL